MTKAKLCERYGSNSCPIIATPYWLDLLKRQHIQAVITPEAPHGKPNWSETERAWNRAFDPYRLTNQAK